MSARATVALRRQGAPDLLVAHAEAVERLSIGPDARRIRRSAAARLLGIHLDLAVWMARPTPARLADLRRSGAWPFLAWCFAEGHLRPDLDLLLAKAPPASSMPPGRSATAAMSPGSARLALASAGRPPGPGI